jgi:2,3-bisphosphoglycerate-independent phosphoglycerate mutase
MARVLFVFLDGVGLGSPDPDRNPFLNAHLPTFRTLLGGSVPLWPPAPGAERTGARLIPLDACLGVDGLPQSGTGQIALLTGLNAPQLFRRHFGPWPPVRLRPLLARENLMSRASREGHRVAFANAYPAGYPGDRNPRRVAAPPLAARAAGVLTRHREALTRGEAVASEIVNEGWRKHLGALEVPRIAPEDAGRNLARIARDAQLTFFAHYLTDLAGHRGGMEGAVQALERVDAFLAGVLSGLDSDISLVLASDHGNVEDVSGGHTRNPALGLATGPFLDELERRAPGLAEVGSQAAGGSRTVPDPLPLTRLAPAILDFLKR